MHADLENLISWYLSIWRFDLGIGHTITIIRISRSFLWYVMNELMHVMQLKIFGYMDGHSSHLLRLNYGCKIEFLQQWRMALIVLRKQYKQKIIFSFKDHYNTQPWILNRTKLHTSLSNPSMLPPKVFTSLSICFWVFRRLQYHSIVLMANFSYF